MKDCYELKNPRKNPYAERMKNGYTIIIDRDTDEDIAQVRAKLSPIGEVINEIARISPTKRRGGYYGNN